MQDFEKGSKYARNQHGQWVCASDAVQDPDTSFFCDCPAMHKMKLVKPSGLPDKRSFMDYFAHVSSGHKRTSDGELVITSCCSGGESLEHKHAKHKLREMVGQFSFVVEKCRSCQLELVEDGRDAGILVEVRSDDGRWRYDCVLIRDDVKVVALEIYHRHATTQDKVLATRQDGLQIAEFRAEDVNALVPGARLVNMQIRKFLCHGCQLIAGQAFRLRCLREEQDELIRQASLVEDEMVNRALQADWKRRALIKRINAETLQFYQDERKQLTWLEDMKEEEFWNLYQDRIYYYSTFKDGRCYNYLSTKKPDGPTYGQLYLSQK